MATNSSGKRSVSSTISPAFISGIEARLRENRRVRRTLPGWGRIHVDRQLPFLSVYRRQTDFIDLDIQHLVTSEAAYLYTTAERRYHTGLVQLVSEVADVMVEQFGAFLLLELWPNMFDEERDRRAPAGDSASSIPYYLATRSSNWASFSTSLSKRCRGSDSGARWRTSTWFPGSVLGHPNCDR